MHLVIVYYTPGSRVTPCVCCRTFYFFPRPQRSSPCWLTKQQIRPRVQTSVAVASLLLKYELRIEEEGKEIKISPIHPLPQLGVRFLTVSGWNTIYWVGNFIPLARVAWIPREKKLRHLLWSANISPRGYVKLVPAARGSQETCFTQTLTERNMHNRVQVWAYHNVPVPFHSLCKQTRATWQISFTAAP